MLANWSHKDIAWEFRICNYWWIGTFTNSILLQKRCYSLEELITWWEESGYHTEILCKRHTTAVMSCFLPIVSKNCWYKKTCYIYYLNDLSSSIPLPLFLMLIRDMVYWYILSWTPNIRVMPRSIKIISNIISLV